MQAFADGRLTEVGEILANRKALLYIVPSGGAGALSWLFYFIAIQKGEVSKVARSTSSASCWPWGLLFCSRGNACRLPRARACC